MPPAEQPATRSAVPLPGSSADDRPSGSRWNRTRIPRAFCMFHVVCGIASVSLIRMIDLIALEPVFPRHHQPDRRAVLVRHRLAIQTRSPGWSADASPHPSAAPRDRASQECPAPAPAFPRDAPAFQTPRYFAPDCTPTLVQQVRQLQPVPRHHHRPGLDTAEPIDALLQRHPRRSGRPAHSRPACPPARQP